MARTPVYDRFGVKKTVTPKSQKSRPAGSTKTQGGSTKAKVERE